MSIIFLQPFPWTWLVQDLLALGLLVYVLVYVFKRETQVTSKVLEIAAFIFLFAAIYENAAGVMGLYTFGRSLVMIGFVPASVPVIEICVLFTGLWFLEKTRMPTWTKPLIVGLFGMLQDFSLDPLAIRQVYTVAGTTSGRWTWWINPATDANILNVPVYNFPGWMLIMLFGTSMILLGRWWHKKTNYNRVVGIVYPFLSMFVALLLMISPLSSFLLWLGPIFQKGQQVEWALLAFHLLVPTLLLLFIWRGRNTARYDTNDWPIFVVPTLLHLSDIAFTLIGGFYEILWIVLLASLVQCAFLAYAYLKTNGKSAQLESA